MSHLILTGDMQERHQKMIPVEKLRQKSRDYCMYHLGQGAFMLDAISDPTRAAKQMGEPLSSAALEKKLLQMSPNFKFFPATDYVIWGSPLVPNDTHYPMKSLFYIGGPEPIPITNYHADSSPEWSLWDWRIETIPDPNFTHANRLDYPKMEWGGWEKGFVTDPEAPIPGYIKVKKPWHEIRRGWRTILVYIVRHGLFSPEYMEKFFRPGDRASWAQHLGKQAGTHWS